MKPSAPFVFIVFLVILVITVACTAQGKASRFGNTVIVDTLPDDICIINGEPQIISLNIEQDDDVGLTYINTNGDLFTQLYGQGLVGFATEKMGSIVFDGDLCP